MDLEKEFELIARTARIEQWQNAFRGQYAGAVQDDDLMVRAVRHAFRTYYGRLGLSQIFKILPSPRAVGEYIWEHMDKVESTNPFGPFQEEKHEYQSFGWRDRYDRFATGNRRFARARREIKDYYQRTVSWNLDRSLNHFIVTLAEIDEALYMTELYERICSELWEGFFLRSSFGNFLRILDQLSVVQGRVANRSQMREFLVSNPFFQAIITDILSFTKEGDHDYQPWFLAGNALIDAVGYGLGCIFPTRRVTLLLPVPRLYENDEGFHRETGPAIEWPDGTGWYYRNGVHIPGWICEQPDLITAEKILEEGNTEIRRVMLDQFGREKFLAEANAYRCDESAWGILWRYMNPRNHGENEQMVEVVCPTTGHRYFLEVPFEVRTAHEAVAWTFERTPETYRPEVQT